MGSRESDLSIVLGARESRVHGEGTNGHTQLSKETSAGSVRPEPLMQTSLRGIASKAKRCRKQRFRGLYRLLNTVNLKSVFYGLNKKAAAGADGVTYRKYEKNLCANVAELVQTLKDKRYRAKLVRRVYIPKGEGKTRPLGIPAVSDKLLQSAASKILSSIYEQDFLPYSYGYRPNKGVRDAVEALRGSLRQKCTWVVEADIKGYFDNINHDWMIRMIEERVNDKAFTRLIKKWLKAGVLDMDKHVVHPATGTPQGGIISPVLANIYLHYSLDLWFEKVYKPTCRGEAFLIRYADDYVAGFRYHDDAVRFYSEMAKRLKKFGLTIAEDKSGIKLFTRFRKRDSRRFDFLGFEFRWGRSRNGKNIIKQRTSRKKFRNSLARFKLWVMENRNMRIGKLFHEVNAKLRGYYNFYGITNNGDSLKKFYGKIKLILYYWLNRRSERRSYNRETFEEILSYYGLLPPRIVWGVKRQLCMDLA